MNVLSESMEIAGLRVQAGWLSVAEYYSPTNCGCGTSAYNAGGGEGCGDVESFNSVTGWPTAAGVANIWSRRCAGQAEWGLAL